MRISPTFHSIGAMMLVTSVVACGVEPAAENRIGPAERIQTAAEAQLMTKQKATVAQEDLRIVSRTFIEQSLTSNKLDNSGDTEIEIELGTEFLDCIKKGVIDCGGNHNGGNCYSFRHWPVPPTDLGRYVNCAQVMGIGCGILNPIGLLACRLSG